MPSSVVIVSDQCYLLAEAINYITINEDDDSDDRAWKPVWKERRRLTKRAGTLEKIINKYMMERKPYHIIINFIPKNQPANNALSKGHDIGSTVQIRVHGYKRALVLFQDIVGQLREQLPDEFYLTKLVEKFLAEHAEE
jgi:hypothetical protein